MNKLRNERERLTLRARFNSIPLAGRLFLVFNLVAVLLAPLSVMIVGASAPHNSLIGIEALFVFLLLYFVIVLITITMSSRYNQDRNVSATLIPALMTAIGILVAFYIYASSATKDMPLFMSVLFIAGILIVPIISTFLDRTLSFKNRTLYFVSLLQIVVAALVTLGALKYF